MKGKKLLSLAILLFLAFTAFGFTNETNNDTIWRANFDIELKYEVKDDGLVGYVVSKVMIGAWFTVDYTTDTLKMVSGLVNITVSDNISVCDASSAMGNDVLMPIDGINGVLNDSGEIVFNKNFVIPKFKEGHKLTCRGYTTSDPNASVIDLIGQKAFPITILLQDGAAAPIKASYSFAGRQAAISGTAEIHEAKEGEIAKEKELKGWEETIEPETKTEPEPEMSENEEQEAVEEISKKFVDEVKGAEKGELYLNGGRTYSIAKKKDKNVENILKLAAVKLIKTGKYVDLGRDNVDDRVQVKLNLPIIGIEDLGGKLMFDEDVGGGGGTAIKKIKMPKVVIGSELMSGKAKEVVLTGNKPLIKMTGPANEEGELILIKNNEEKEIYAGKVNFDKEGRAVLEVEKELEDGTYGGILKIDGTEVSVDAMLEVNEEEGMEAPEIKYNEKSNSMIKTVELVVNFAAKIKKIPANKILGIMKEEVPGQLTGESEKGSYIFIIWQSVNLYSVVLADARNGKFEVETPKKLVKGAHQAMVYTYDAKKSRISNVSKLKFNK